MRIQVTGLLIPDPSNRMGQTNVLLDFPAPREAAYLWQITGCYIRENSKPRASFGFTAMTTDTLAF